MWVGAAERPWPGRPTIGRDGKTPHPAPRKDGRVARAHASVPAHPQTRNGSPARKAKEPLLSHTVTSVAMGCGRWGSGVRGQGLEDAQRRKDTKTGREGFFWDTAGVCSRSGALRVAGHFLSQNRGACVLRHMARSPTPISAQWRAPSGGGYGRSERRARRGNKPVVSFGGRFFGHGRF
jgi:hypothetical protein